jgi:hypothetical protein
MQLGEEKLRAARLKAGTDVAQSEIVSRVCAALRRW